METYRFHFNTRYAVNLRDSVNDRLKQSLDNIHQEKQIVGPYYAWNRTCAAMDRLEDTLSYINSLELGKNKDFRSAFDFCDFINNAYIVVDCIKTIGRIFRVDDKLIDEIEKSTEVFRNDLIGEYTDQKYFEYIRALCSVHPLCTNRQKEFLNGSQFHCCPFVTWDHSLINNCENSDLTAVIYPSSGEKTIHLGLKISQFEEYLTKWIEFIPRIIEAKNAYTDKEYEKLRQEPVKQLFEFEDDIIQYLAYLKGEYCKRFDYGFDYLFDEYINFFSIKLSSPLNNTLLKKYQNAVLYSLKFLRNNLQNMSYEGYENNGIKHPESLIETTLFDSIYNIPLYGSDFSVYSYCLGKLYYLSSDSSYGYYEKMYARHLLESPKELINRYVHFTNTEPDAERIVLVQLALYLDALSRKSFLNKNIPNTSEYRIKILSKEEYDQLFVEENRQTKADDISQDLLELIEKYGG